MNLQFDTGDISLHVQGDPSRVFTFNPTNPSLQAGFFALIKASEDKVKEYTAKAVIVDSQNLEELEVAEKEVEFMLEIDIWLREEFEKLFGEGTANIVFGKTATSATGSNGDYVFSNMMMALYPYFEKEAKARYKKLDSIIADHKPPKRNNVKSSKKT